MDCEQRYTFSRSVQKQRGPTMKKDYMLPIVLLSTVFALLEAVRKGLRSHFPLLSFHWLLEPLALQAKAHLHGNISHWLPKWLVRLKQLIHANGLQKAFRTASSHGAHDSGRQCSYGRPRSWNCDRDQPGSGYAECGYCQQAWQGCVQSNGRSL